MGKKINIAIYLVLLNLFVCGIKYGESGIPVKKSVNLRNSYENKKNSQTDVNTANNTNIQDDQTKLVIEGNDEDQPSNGENVNEEDKEKQLPSSKDATPPSDPAKVSNQEGSSSDTLKKTDGASDKGDTVDGKEGQPDASSGKTEETLPKVNDKGTSEQGVQETPSNPDSQTQTQIVNNPGGETPTVTNKPGEEAKGTESIDNNGETAEGGAIQKTVQENSDNSLGDKKPQTGDADNVVQSLDKKGEQSPSPTSTEGQGVTPPVLPGGKSDDPPSGLSDKAVDSKQSNNEGSAINEGKESTDPKKDEGASAKENPDSITKEETKPEESVTGKNSDKGSVSDVSPENVIDNTEGKTKEVQGGTGEDSNNLADNTKTEEPSKDDKKKEESNSIVEVPPVAPTEVPEKKETGPETLDLPPAKPNNADNNLNVTESHDKTSSDIAPKEDGNNDTKDNQTNLEEAGNDPKSETDSKDNAVNKNVELRYDNIDDEEDDENVIDESVNVIESDTGNQDDKKEEIESEEDDEDVEAEETVSEANETNENEKETPKKEENIEEPTTIDSKAKKIISEYYTSMKNIKNKIKDYVNSAMDLIDSNNGISKAFSNFSEDISNFILKL
ncbi:conserved Plasmodium protein, unknown function [Plasmodium vinckei vinckei]|uniref:Uncharacterized protein n=1 Tax=Plasmodium vinckei vinckei TaxID=54757 RepID=A0A081ICC8_PLAVN|nr:conserved Plasmodium protein, unknown function [Plasmodium vinckei vinckei]KEG01336.1 hypothetical protein YYE_03924 [Plasmodium vinckei vinckei]VEV55312.1 conserved Plasmodium protein, unknown function [Plasmodium vinckei vinckei]